MRVTRGTNPVKIEFFIKYAFKVTVCGFQQVNNPISTSLPPCCPPFGSYHPPS